MTRAGLCLMTAVLLAGCPRQGIDWQGYISMRATGPNLLVGSVDPAEVVSGKISRNLHYVSIALETIFYRDLPGVRPGQGIALGVQVQGVLPDGTAVKAVPDLTHSTGSNAFFFFRNAFLLQPFLYLGRNIEITLSFRPADKEQSQNIRGRIQGVRDLVRKLNPLVPTVIEKAREVFTGITGTFTETRSSWTHTITLAPADQTIRDKSENLFTAARHILLAMPPASAPAALRKLSPKALRSQLRLRGSQLLWAASGKPYTETPYVILNVTRYRRYPPSQETELSKLVRQRAVALARGNLQQAVALQRGIREAIVTDRIITATEKNLERAWVEVWDARIAGERASLEKRDGDVRHNAVVEAQRLAQLKEYFRHILLPAEIEDIRYRLTQLAARAEGNTIKSMGEHRPPNPVAVLLERDRRRERRIADKLARERAFFRKALSRGGAVRKGRPGWVEASAEVSVAPGERTGGARARAIAAARRSAVRNAVGRGGAAAFAGRGTARRLPSRRVVEKLERLLSRALVVDEKILSEGRTGSLYRVKIRARVVLRGARTDPGYRVRLRMSRRTLQEGDAVEVRVRPTRDSYLYLFSVTANGDVSVVVPNPFLRQAPLVRAGQEFVFPGPKAGVARIVARLPSGVQETAERLKAIALRRRIDLLPSRRGQKGFQSFKAKDPLLLTTILRALSKVDPDLWTDDTVRYTVKAK